MQWIFVGDLLQLPAVQARTRGYIFNATQWRRLQIKVCELTTVYRQSNDAFLAVLSRVRKGLLSAEDQAWIENNSLKQPHPLSTCLFAKNDDAAMYNRQCLARIPGQTHAFYAIDRGDPYSLNAVSAEQSVFLKERAMVTCLRNLVDQPGCKLMNGTVGYIESIGLDPATSQRTALVTARFFSVDTSTWFNHSFRSGSLPENQFDVTRKDKVIATRFQIPLRLAWGQSIHRAQGASLSYAHVDLRGCFEYGQAYVALSRVHEVQNLHVQGLLPRVVKASPEVLKFYSECAQSR